MARKEEEDEEEVKEEEMNGRREKKDWKRAKNKLQNIEILIKSQHKSKIIFEPYRNHPEHEVHLVRRSRCVQPDRNPFSPSTPSHLEGHPLLPFNPLPSGRAPPPPHIATYALSIPRDDQKIICRLTHSHRAHYRALVARRHEGSTPSCIACRERGPTPRQHRSFLMQVRGRPFKRPGAWGVSAQGLSVEKWRIRTQRKRRSEQYSRKSTVRACSRVEGRA